MRWFISDLHIGHANIIRFCKRPFGSAEEMDAVLVREWNATVSVDDEVWVVGDFAYRCSKQYAQLVFDSLAGRKHLVRGGHDFKVACRLNGWASVEDIATIRDVSPVLVLCHYPLLHWWGEHRGSVMIHGHTHSPEPISDPSKRRYNVCVDANLFSPVSLGAILAAFGGSTDGA